MAKKHKKWLKWQMGRKGTEIRRGWERIDKGEGDAPIPERFERA